MRRALFIALALFAAACKSDPTGLLLTISSDLVALDAIDIAIAQDPDAGFVDGKSSSSCVCVNAGCSTSASLPLLVPLVPGHQGEGNFLIEARAHKTSDCSDESYLVAQAVTQFVEHKELTVSMQLNTKCIAVVCDEGETCDPSNGDCVTNYVPPSLPDMQAPPSASDLSVPIDLSSADLAPSIPFALISPAPDSWDVAASIEVVSLASVANGVAQWANVQGTALGVATHAQIVSKAQIICAAKLSEAFVYAVGYEDSSTSQLVTAFDATGKAISDATWKQDAVSSLACAAQSDAGKGATVTWLVPPSFRGAETFSTLNVATAIGNGSTPNLHTINVAAYELSRAHSAARTSLLYAPASNGPATPTVSVTEYVVETKKSSPVSLDPTQPFAVADFNSRRTVVGMQGDSVVFGADDTPSPIDAPVPVQLELIGLESSKFALGLLGKDQGLRIYGADATTANLVSQSPVVVSTTADGSRPVRMVVTRPSDAPLLLVTWVDTIPGGTSVLMGQYVNVP